MSWSCDTEAPPSLVLVMSSVVLIPEKAALNSFKCVSAEACVSDPFMSKSPRDEWQGLKQEVSDTTVKRRQEKRERDAEWQRLLKNKPAPGQATNVSVQRDDKKTPRLCMSRYLSPFLLVCRRLPCRDHSARAQQWQRWWPR